MVPVWFRISSVRKAGQRLEKVEPASARLLCAALPSWVVPKALGNQRCRTIKVEHGNGKEQTYNIVE